MATTAITPAEQDQRGVDLAAADDRGPALGQADGEDDDADHGGHEPEEDAGVAEGSVHRWEPVTAPSAGWSGRSSLGPVRSRDPTGVGGDVGRRVLDQDLVGDEDRSR